MWLWQNIKILMALLQYLEWDQFVVITAWLNLCLEKNVTSHLPKRSSICKVLWIIIYKLYGLQSYAARGLEMCTVSQIWELKTAAMLYRSDKNDGRIMMSVWNINLNDKFIEIVFVIKTKQLVETSTKLRFCKK